MSKKENNIPKGRIPDKPGYLSDRPPASKMPITLSKFELVEMFNEWNKRYSEDPKSFKASLDDDGKPVSDYGINCAGYFIELYHELY